MGNLSLDENKGCFQAVDYASSPFRLKVKEALHINYLKPDLNKQKEHVSITNFIPTSNFFWENFGHQ